MGQGSVGGLNCFWCCCWLVTCRGVGVEFGSWVCLIGRMGGAAFVVVLDPQPVDEGCWVVVETKVFNDDLFLLL